MLGTLNGALEARGIAVPTLTARAEGANEIVDGIVTLTKINVHYTLTVPREKRDAVDRALAKHQDKCPTAQSLKNAVAIGWTADIVETD